MQNDSLYMKIVAHIRLHGRIIGNNETIITDDLL